MVSDLARALSGGDVYLHIGVTLYDAWRFQDSQVLVGLALPVLYVLLLCTRAARSWFRWGTW